MSDATLPRSDDPFPGQRAARPWRAALLGATAVIAVGALLVMFTGRVAIFHRTEQAPAPPKVQLTPNVTPVVRPVEAPAVAPQAQRPIPRPGFTIPGMSDETKKARESPIGMYAMRAATAAAAAAKPAAGSLPGSDPDAIPISGQPDALEASLTPTKMNGTRVSELPNPRWLVEEGRILPCGQQTRINSTLPGGVTAIISQEIRGETGDVVLMPKGAKVFGTIQHALINGLDRLAVLWQDITTPVLYDERGMPHQFRVAVNSPAASELGETGLDGDVNRHLFNPFPGKLGAILGMSLIQGGVQAGVNYANRNQGNGSNNGNNYLNFNSFQQGSQSAADELLRSFIHIPDIMTRDQGLACSIFVVRDLDFRGAYSLVRRYRS